MGWSATTGQVEPWVYQRLTETFVTDEAMRRRLASLNPEASNRMAQRLLEASDRAYWTPDPATLALLFAAGLLGGAMNALAGGGTFHHPIAGSAHQYPTGASAVK